MFRRKISQKLVAAALLSVIVLAQADTAFAWGRHHRRHHRRHRRVVHYYWPPVLGGLALMFGHSYVHKEPEKTVVIIKDKENRKDDSSCSCSHKCK